MYVPLVSVHVLSQHALENRVPYLEVGRGRRHTSIHHWPTESVQETECSQFMLTLADIRNDNEQVGIYSPPGTRTETVNVDFSGMWSDTLKFDSRGTPAYKMICSSHGTPSA